MRSVCATNGTSLRFLYPHRAVSRLSDGTSPQFISLAILLARRGLDASLFDRMARGDNSVGDCDADGSAEIEEAPVGAGDFASGLEPF